MTRVSFVGDSNKLINAFEVYTIGFNHVLQSVVSSINTNFPPTNLVKVGETEYLVEIALAGFRKEDISISLANNILTIEGKKEQEKRDYIFNGIAARHFKRELPIADGVEVKSASMTDGILNITLSYQVNTKMIEIN